MISAARVPGRRPIARCRDRSGLVELRRIELVELLRKPNLQNYLQQIFHQLLRPCLTDSIGRAERFERPTPCAQDGDRGFRVTAYFQRLGFKGVVRFVLKPVVPWRKRRLSAATKSSTLSKLAEFPRSPQGSVPPCWLLDDCLALFGC